MINDNVKIVSPAGNFTKLKTAVAFGADEVYFGGSEFNLRNKADNFSTEELAEAARYCRERGVKTIFLLNVFLRESDIDGAERLIESIKDIPFDAVTLSDPGMLELVREAELPFNIHLSTQASTLNRLSFKFWERQGISRIVLARECTVADIRRIKEHTNAEIEVFAHGAVCISYSGRCLLSRYMIGKDANFGECTHPCRWKFTLVEDKRPNEPFPIIEHPHGTEILSSKDLCILPKLGEYIDAGVSAFKIEGRMKSAYYVANVTRIYKEAVRIYRETKDLSPVIENFMHELDLVSHRPFSDDIFNEFDKEFEPLSYIQKADFMGVVIGRTDARTVITRCHNPIRPGTRLEAIFPIDNGKIIDGYYTVVDILDCDSDTLKYELARPNATYRLVLDREIPDGAVFRIRLQE